MPEPVPFNDLTELAQHLREELESKKFILLYAYNGVGKTRLSTEFKNLGKDAEDEDKRDTLYFNAFTEDLFTWDNDLEGDELRVLELNAKSRFFDGLGEFEIENRVRALLNRYADFGFRMDLIYRDPAKDDKKPRLEKGRVTFNRKELIGEGESARSETVENIKISRGEENIFIWCFFLAVVQLTIDKEIAAYSWVKYIYIDDPVSSLDEHNSIIVANHLVQVFREANSVGVGTVISTHHQLFFNVLHYELKNNFKQPRQYVLSRDCGTEIYRLTEERGDTPSFHHVAALVELDKVARQGTIHTYHFNILRAVLEKTALFHGYNHFGMCIKKDSDDAEGLLHQRFVDLLSHGKYSLYEPKEMGVETKKYFRKIVRNFLERYPFNSKLFPIDPIPEVEEESTPEDDPTPMEESILVEVPASAEDSTVDESHTSMDDPKTVENATRKKDT